MIDNDVDSVATNKPYILTGNRKEPGIKRTPNKLHGNKLAIPVSSPFSYSPKLLDIYVVMILSRRDCESIIALTTGLVK